MHGAFGAVVAFLGKPSVKKTSFPWYLMGIARYAQSLKCPMFRCGFGTTSQGLCLYMVVLSLHVFLPIINGLLSSVRCPVIRSIIAVKVRGNAQIALENRRNWLFFCTYSRVVQAWSLPWPKTSRNTGQRVRMTFVRKNLQPDGWDQGELQARDFP